MKIIFSPEVIQHSFIRGIASALNAMGEEVILWSHRVSAFDAFDVDKPDILFMSNTNLTKEILFALTQHPEIKIVLYSTALPKTMKENCNPSVIIVPPGMPNHVAKNIEHDNIYETQCAANVVNYTNGYYVDRAFSDILVIVDRAISLNHLILQQINNTLALMDKKVKCIGHRIHTPLYVGQTSDIEISCFMKSSSLIVCYTYDMIFNCIANKAFCITPHQQDWMPQFTDDESLIEAINIFDNEKQKRAMVKRAYKDIFKQHTYFHRVIELGQKLEIEEWTEKAISTLPRYKI